MASNTTLDKALGEVLSEIRRGLADKIKKALHEKIESLRKTKGLNKLIDQRNNIKEDLVKLQDNYYKQQRELENKKHQLEIEIEKLDIVSDEEADDNSEIILDLIGRAYHTTKSELQAAKIISKTVEAKNYFNFLQVEKNTMMMYNLAVTAKEKRGIIISIQTRDWRSLGIDIPQLPYMEKFDIENGEIKVPDRLLIEASK